MTAADVARQARGTMALRPDGSGGTRRLRISHWGAVFVEYRYGESAAWDPATLLPSDLTAEDWEAGQ